MKISNRDSFSFGKESRRMTLFSKKDSRKYGLISPEDDIILPCVFDLIHYHLDGIDVYLRYKNCCFIAYVFTDTFLKKEKYFREDLPDSYCFEYAPGRYVKIEEGRYEKGDDPEYDETLLEKNDTIKNEVFNEIVQILSDTLTRKNF